MFWSIVYELPANERLHFGGRRYFGNKSSEYPVLQVRRGNRDNLGIIFLIFPLRYIL